MRIGKFGVAAVAMLGALALGGCAYDDYGYGGGYGYPYSGVSVGVGYGGGYGYYGGGYGYGGMYSPFGWYDDFYYPGTGFYVYDSYRRPHVMSTTQRQYWTTRSPALRTTTTTRTRVQPNWTAFDRRAERQTVREQKRQERQDRRRDN